VSQDFQICETVMRQRICAEILLIYRQIFKYLASGTCIGSNVCLKITYQQHLARVLCL